MSRQPINIGTNPNDGTGDALRVAFNKINQNFIELYGTDGIANEVKHDPNPQLGGNLDVYNYSIFNSAANGNVAVSANGTGQIQLNSSTTVTGALSVTGNATVNGNLQLASGPYIIGVSSDPAMGGSGPSDNLIPTQAATNAYLATLLQNAYIISITTDNGVLDLFDGDPFTLHGTGGILTAADNSSKNLSVGIDNNIIVTRTDTQTLTNKTLTAPAITDPVISGTATVNNIALSGNTIATLSNNDLILAPNGTGRVIIGSEIINAATITSLGDVAITLAENVGITGALTVAGGLAVAGINNTGSQIVAGNLSVDGNLYADNITSAASNADMNISAQGTGVVNVQSPLTTVAQTVNGTATITGQFKAGNISVDGNTIAANNTNGGVTISPNGTGSIILNGSLVGVPNTLSANAVETASINRVSSNADLAITTNGTGTINFTLPTTTAGVASGQANTAGVATYLVVKIGGTSYAIPAYAINP